MGMKSCCACPDYGFSKVVRWGLCGRYVWRSLLQFMNVGLFAKMKGTRGRSQEEEEKGNGLHVKRTQKSQRIKRSGAEASMYRSYKGGIRSTLERVSY